MAVAGLHPWAAFCMQLGGTARPGWESTAYSDAPGVRSLGIGDLLASSFAFFPWS